jgi:hypothetical protein
VILEESGEAAFHRRLSALARGNAQKPEAFDGLYYGTNLRVKLDDASWQNRLLDAANAIKPRAVFLDPLVRLKGARDENSQKDMEPVLEYMRVLRDESQAAVLFAHHMGYAGQHSRGSSDIEGFWESKLTITKKDGVRHVTSEHREAEDGEPWEYRLSWDGLTRSMRLVAEGRPVDSDVVSYLAANPTASATEVYEALGGRKQNVLAAVRRCREGGSQLREPVGTTPAEAPSEGGSPDPLFRGVGNRHEEPGSQVPEPPLVDEDEVERLHRRGEEMGLA